MGPLKVLASNPRYFTDGSGKAIYLTGSHTWTNLQDTSVLGPFDYTAYLQLLVQENHNFIRLWHLDALYMAEPLTPWRHLTPLPFQRVSGFGTAADGLPKVDLTQFHQPFFDRLRTRVLAARDRGLYVSIMLFDGWGVETEPSIWQYSMYNPANNLNGIPVTKEQLYALSNLALVTVQEAFVRKVVDTVNDLDNVLFEIANEGPSWSVPWQFHMIDVIHAYEATKPQQHPVLFSAPWATYDWRTSPAAAYAPGWDGATGNGAFVPYRDDPPATDGHKVIINDTDHLWGIGGTSQWVWKSFTRGLHPIYMDPYGVLPNYPPNGDVRKNMGYTLTYANKMNLAKMIPCGDLASTKYCLANPGIEYLIYLPPRSPERGVIMGRGNRIIQWVSQHNDNRALGWLSQLIGLTETVKVDLSAASGALSVEWFNPATGEIIAVETTGGSIQEFTAPFSGDAILYIKDDRKADSGAK
jgi:hypothetical protein